MNNKEFAKIALEIADNYRTVYGKGMIGLPINEENLAKMKAQYPSWYTDKKMASFLSDQGRFGFDCVCLIKAILWDWKGDKDAWLGGAVYCSNGVPDFSVNGMLDLCTELSNDFSNIEVGEVLWMEGHVGIYVGDGIAVECTAAWDNCVLKSAVANIGTKFDHYSRKWVKHGKLKYIDYIIGGDVLEGYCMKPLEKGDIGGEVKALQILLAEKGYFAPDGSFGPITESAVRAFQKDHGLDVTGRMSKMDWEALIGG